MNIQNDNQYLMGYLHDSARHTYAPRTRDLLTTVPKVEFMPMVNSRSKVKTDFNTGEIKKVGFSQYNGNRVYTYMTEAEYVGSKVSFLKTYPFKSDVHMNPEDLIRMTRVMEIDAYLDLASKVAHDFCNEKIDKDNFNYQNKYNMNLPSIILQSLCLGEASLKADQDFIRVIGNEKSLKNNCVDMDLLRPEMMYLLSQNKALMQSFSEQALENMTTSMEKAVKYHGILMHDDVVCIGKNKIKPLQSTFDKNDMTACVNRFGLEPLMAMGEEKAEAFWNNVSALSLKDEMKIADIRQQEKRIFIYV